MRYNYNHPVPGLTEREAGLVNGRGRQAKPFQLHCDRPMTVKWSHNIFLGIEFVNLSYRELCTQYRDSTFTDFNGKSWDRTTQHFSHHKTSQTQAIKVQIRSNSCKLILTMKGWSCTGLIDFLLFLKFTTSFVLLSLALSDSLTESILQSFFWKLLTSAMEIHWSLI